MLGRRNNRNDAPGATGPRDSNPGPGHADSGPDRYKMQEHIFTIGDDFWIETMRGRRAYKVDGKAIRLRNTLLLEDPHGREVYHIQSKVIAIKDKMAVTDPHGRDVAVMTHALVSPLRDRMTANVPGGPDIDIKGNILNHEYTMERRGKRICEVSKRWVAIRETYTVEIDAGEDDALILALTVVVDQMCAA